MTKTTDGNEISVDDSSVERNKQINPPELGHDRQEGGMEEKASPTEEELWIKQPKALQLRAPQEGTNLSPLNPRTRIQTIVRETSN